MRGMRQTVHLAQEMAKGVGRCEVLQCSLSHESIEE